MKSVTSINTGIDNVAISKCLAIFTVALYGYFVINRVYPLITTSKHHSTAVLIQRRSEDHLLYTNPLYPTLSKYSKRQLTFIPKTINATQLKDFLPITESVEVFPIMNKPTDPFFHNLHMTRYFGGKI